YHTVPVAICPGFRPGEWCRKALVFHDRVCGAERDCRHVLYATGDDQIRRSRHNCLCRVVDGLLARTTLPVDRCARNGFCPAGTQPSGAGNIKRLGTDLINTTEDNFVVFACFDTDAVEYGG